MQRNLFGSFFPTVPPVKRFRIIQPEIEFISLCPKGKNRLPVLYKSDDGTFSVETLIKDEGLQEKGELWAIVYAPDLVDADGHFAEAEDIRKMAHSHMRAGGKLDLRHNGHALAKEQAYLAESFIVQKGDERFAGLKDTEQKPVDATGAWAILVQVDSFDLRKEYREGKWNGVSLFGHAQLEPVAKGGDAVDEILQALAARLRQEDQGTEEDMDETLLRKVLGEERTLILKEVQTQIAAAIEPLKPKAPAAPIKKEGEGAESEPPKFVGSRTNPAHIKKHLRKMKSWQASQEIDWTDVDAVEEHLQEMIEKGQDEDDEEDDDLDLECDTRKPKRGSARKETMSKSSRLEKELDDVVKRMSAYANASASNDEADDN